MRRRPCKVYLRESADQGASFAEGWIDIDSVHLQAAHNIALHDESVRPLFNVALYDTADSPALEPSVIIPTSNVAAIKIGPQRKGSSTA